MYGDNKKTYIIVGGIIIIAIILTFLISFFIFRSGGKDVGKNDNDKKRNNIVKLINRYFNQEEYDRALKLIEDLLIENGDDREALDLQDKIIRAKKEKERLAESSISNRDYDTRKIIESMSAIIENKDDKPTIVRKSDETSAEKNASIGKEELAKKKKISELIDAGINEYNKQNYAKSKDNFLGALDMESDNAEANAYLGAAIYEENPDDENSINEAVKFSKKALQKDNNIEQAHYTLAKIYDKQGLRDLALEEYKEALKINPQNYDAFYAIGRMYYKEKEFLKA
ncbi:MAG TPA: tetratricopeptide repeat protein, partial [Spirochaetota bacterium]|nr:tetratricopeptide repeat protein [Spirochaetota bacterium]